MANRHTPLFHPRTLERALKQARFPSDLEARRAMLEPWLVDLDARTLRQRREVSTDHAYLSSVFGGILGYRLLQDRVDQSYDLGTQVVAGQSAKVMDGAIGWFSPGERRIHAIIEIKRASQDLDASGGRALTPVQQAWDYANKVGTARWIVVSNFREIRLYCRYRAQHEYERFLLGDLAEVNEFRRFWLLLHRDALLPSTPSGSSSLDLLLDQSAREQKKITDELYGVVTRIRHGLFEDLCRAHSNRPAIEHVKHTQKILDRFLFLAFAEDRGLLPSRTIASTLDAEHAMVDIPKWQALTALCRKVDEGDPKRSIPKLNGGLFANDPELDDLDVPDSACERLRELAAFDFGEDVSVEVLGHIFEQSINDLEDLRAQARGEVVDGVGGRKKHGVFYTPDFVTRYLAERTLEPLLDRLYEECVAEAKFSMELDGKQVKVNLDWLEQELRATRDRVRARAVSQSVDPEQALRNSKAVKDWLARVEPTRRAVWEAWHRRLRTIRVLDPACGSGAFLAAAFDVLAEAYHRGNRELEAASETLGPQTGLFDVEETVLQHNLFGVDLNRESVEVTKLSMWLKTATDSRPLTWLDGNVQAGDSIVDDPRVSPMAFDWKAGHRASAPPGWLFEDKTEQSQDINQRWRDGFDVVLGNPPYVRQEWLTDIKPHLQAHYKVWHGMADLFVYFFERALQQLKPGGRLGFIVANKWLKGGYAGALREYLSGRCVIEEIVDFGHAPIFPDADAFPSVVIVRRLREGELAPTGTQVRVAQLPREELHRESLHDFVASRQVAIPHARFGREPWSLEPPEVEQLMDHMREVGVPLAEWTGQKPLYGVKTGFNEAFLIDEAQRDALVRADPRSAEVIKPYLRGQDVGRWVPDWDRRYMIFARRGIEIARYPAVLEHLDHYRERLEPKPKDWADGKWPGRKSGSYAWYEIQDSVDYYLEFDKPKLVYQVIQFYSRYSMDVSGALTNDKCFILPDPPAWSIAVLNSPLLWWHNWRYLVHLKDEALSPLGVKMEALPIAPPDPRHVDASETLVPQIVDLAGKHQAARREMLDWLRDAFDVDKPGRALSAFYALSTDAFVQELQRRRPKRGGRLGPGDVSQLRTQHRVYAEAWHQRQVEILTIERQLSDLVLDAYGLTEAQVDLVRRTAPPRMPPGL